MAEDEMYLSNLEAWVCEEKKNVTFKWLSNQLSVPSNVAKQMLHAFVEKKGDEVQTVYLLSGHRKDHGHTVALVARSKLAEAKKQFDSIYSLHVYSVHAVLPKDSAQLWALDHEQSKELLTQPDNPITSNRWSAIHYPEASQRREVPRHSIEPEPVQPLPKKVKAETKVKVQPKEEAELSQSSSPEKEKQTNTKTGRITTNIKKGSPTKKQPQSMEMTAFFKKAPEEEKSKTLLANASTKTKGASPKKKTAMDTFFAKKEKNDVVTEAGENTVLKIKQEKIQAEDTELDDLLANEVTKDAFEHEAHGAAGKERKESAKRTRLQKGKRKRNDDDEDMEATGEGHSHVEQSLPERKHLANEDKKPQKDKGNKKKRRKVIKQEPEDERDTESEETIMTAAAPGKKKESTKATKKEPSENEEDMEKENEEHNITKENKNAKKTPTKVIERKQGQAKPVAIAPQGPRRKKKVRRERTYVDDKGFEVTEDVWEEISDEDTPLPMPDLASIKNEPAQTDGDSSAKKKSTAQANIMAFFGKGKK